MTNLSDNSDSYQQGALLQEAYRCRPFTNLCINICIENKNEILTLLKQDELLYFSNFLDGQKSTSTSPSLTPREMEVLKWIKNGKTHYEIGIILSISERTVKFHSKNILTKLDASNCPHAVAKAYAQGYLY